MNKEQIANHLCTLPGAKTDHPFGPDVLVFKVMGKMFAYISEKEGTPIVTLKCIPMDGEILSEQFRAINPGYHMNKKHWITISLTQPNNPTDADEISDDMLTDLANKSYELVVSKLTKANRALLQALPKAQDD